MNGGEDVTDIIVRDMQSGLDKHAREARAATKLTSLQQRVLSTMNGKELPFVSNPLVYSKIARSLPKTEQKALYSLVKGGQLRVLRRVGLPSDERVRSESPFAGSHYVLVTAFGARAAGRVFEYLLLLRPASFSTVPSGFVGLRKSENPKYPHGVVQYEKPLRKSDIEAFDLMPLDPLDPVNLRRVRDAWREHVMSRFVEGGREMFNIEDEEIQGFRILTMSTRPGVEYQMTRFQRMGPRGKGRPEPTGHMDFNDFGEAADAMLTRAARRKLVEELVPRA